MNDLPLIFVAGLLGSSHCLGMCGPFAIAIGATQGSWTGSVQRQWIYSGGRIFTYSVLGAAAGFSGQQLGTATGAWLRLPAMLSILAGTVLAYEGLRSVGVFPRKSVSSSGACLMGGFLGEFLRSPKAVDVFLAGLITGFLPCGFVWGFLGLAASRQDFVAGAATMAAFGCGTVPLMVAAGCGGKLLSLAGRRKLFRVAALCLLATGLWTIARGVTYLRHTPSDVPLIEDTNAAIHQGPNCPLCGDESQAHIGS